MAKINTLEGMRNYIKTMLGSPIINIEVTTEQLNQVIEDSVQVMQKYNYGDGLYLDYVAFTTSANVGTYEVMSDPNLSASFVDVAQVFDISYSFGVDGINTLFSPTHILLQENNNGQGMFGSRFLTGNFTPGLEITTYQVAMMYLQEIRDKLGKMYCVNWIPGRGALMITPTPTESVTGLLHLYKREAAVNLYNDNLVKSLCLAKTKIVWGGNIRKYAIQFPGGGTALGSDILSEGREEESIIIDQIKGESEPTDFYFG